MRDNMMSVTISYLEQKQESQKREQAIKEALKGETYLDSSSDGVKTERKSWLSNFHPYLTEEVKNDNNVDETESRRKSSIINTITPGMRFNLRDKQKTFTTDLSLTRVVFNNRGGSNRTYADARSALNYSLGKGMLTIADSYNNYFDPETRLIGSQVRSNQDNPDSDQIGTLRNWKNTFVAGYGRMFNRLGFDTAYQRTDYDDSEDGDYYEDKVSISPYLNLSKKTRLISEYYYKRKIYPRTENPQHSIYNSISLGATSALTPKTTALIKGRYEKASRRNAADYEDYILNGSIGYKINQRSDISLAYEYDNHDSVSDAEVYKRHVLDLSGNNRMAFNPKFRLFYGLSLHYKDYPKFTDSAGFPDSRIDKTYKTKLGCAYNFSSWLDFSLTWTHSKFDSNKQENYTKDVIAFKTEAKF